MRATIKLFVVLLAISCPVGAFAVWSGIVTANDYVLTVGVVGSIASVVGLLSLFAPRLTASDFRNIDAELLESVVEQAKSTREYEKRVAENKRELSALEREREEIELLVRKLSLKVFLEERVRYIAEEIERRISNDPALNDLLLSFDESKRRVFEVDGEIVQSEKADKVQEIVREIRERKTEDFALSIYALLMPRLFQHPDLAVVFRRLRRM